MKRIFALLLVGLLGVGATGARAMDRAELISHVESCEAILREFMAVPSTAIPPAVLHRARGILILNQFKAGFIIGVKGGYGVAMVKRSDGQWSIPVLVKASAASVGFQAGAHAVETIYVFMDDRTPRLLFNKRFHLGVDAKAVAGPHVADVDADDRPLLAEPILMYSKSAGLFAGAAVNAAQISRNDKANFLLYQTQYRMPELLYSDWVQPPPEVRPLMQYMQQIAP
ncbi:MAG: lipid-binding SYLF domain-containing protein [Opitutaceae bacterium]